MKDFGRSIADIATDRRDIYQEKIDEILNETINNFTDMVRETKYNAVVGFRTGVEEYTNNVTAVVASGTLVNIKEQYKSEFDKSSFIRNARAKSIKGGACIRGQGNKDFRVVQQLQ